MAIPMPHPRPPGTREKILDTAGRIFAEKGFRKTTVREIAAQAGVNLNAINYHFGDKQRLYQLVIETAHETTVEDEDLHKARDGNLSPERRLHAFVSAFLRRAIANRPPLRVGRLMAMEMAEPTEALDMVVQKFIKPRFDLLREIVRQILGDQASEPQADLCAESVIGQCLHLVLGRSVIVRLIPHLTYTPENIEQVADHVTRFSVAAIKNLTGSQEVAL